MGIETLREETPSRVPDLDAIRVLQLRTYFFFPFSINSERLRQPDGRAEEISTHWLETMEKRIEESRSSMTARVGSALGYWERKPYTDFTLNSRAYEDMVFFHPFVRHVFFDTRQVGGVDPSLSLIRCYEIPLEGKRVSIRASDESGRPQSVDVTDLRLFFFANGIGILSIGVEKDDLPCSDALWLNEMLRKVYPSSGRQRREGRTPGAVQLVVQHKGQEEVMARESFENCAMIGFEPPLSSVIQTLLYFLDYQRQEYEQVLDERTIVYSYAAIDPDSVPPDFIGSDEYKIVLSRFLYVDKAGEGFRYDPEFTRKLMERQVYRRWAHEGTYYGFTSYSSIVLTLGTGDRGAHRMREGFLIRRMFDTRYYLMAVIALFYRATLLMFNEKTALASRALYQDQQQHEICRAHIETAQHLRAEYLHFSNYWFFEELANKDEESEHFEMQAQQYRLYDMKREVEREIAAMTTSLSDYNQARNTAAVNRLTMLSIILGAGAVMTGFFGMNFGRKFAELFFEPTVTPWIHYISITTVCIFSLAALVLGIYIIVVNWNDYRNTLKLRKGRHSGPFLY